MINGLTIAVALAGALVMFFKSNRTELITGASLITLALTFYIIAQAVL